MPVSTGFIVDIANPIVVFALMLCVGFELRYRDFLGVAKTPKPLIAGTVIQAFVPPAAAIGTILVLQPSPEVTVGITVLSLCPSGTLSNVYSYLARLNLPLSISLTVISALVSIITFPVMAVLLIGSLHVLAEEHPTLPVGKLLAQLMLFAILPVTCGMVLRIFSPNVNAGLQRTLRVSALVLLLIVVGLAFIVTPLGFGEILTRSWLPATIFSGTTLAAAFFFAKMAATDDALVISVEATVRNLPIALVISQGLIGTLMLDYYLGYFLVQAPLLLALAALVRFRGR